MKPGSKQAVSQYMSANSGPLPVCFSPPTANLKKHIKNANGIITLLLHLLILIGLTRFILKSISLQIELKECKQILTSCKLEMALIQQVGVEVKSILVQTHPEVEDHFGPLVMITYCTFN